MKKQNPKLTFIPIFILLMFAAAQSSANGGAHDFTGFLMLEEPINPRNVAMGSAGTALGGAGFRYYNPASPFLSANSSAHVTIEFGQMPGELNTGGFETAFASKEWFTGASFHTSAVDYQTSDERGLGASATAGTTFGALTFGYIRDNAALAVSVNMAEDRITDENNYGAIAAGVGVAYKMLDNRLAFGAAFFHHVAWQSGFDGGRNNWTNGDNVPQFVRGGAAYRDTLFEIPYVVTADVVYGDHGSAGESVTVPVGVEASVLPFLNLRMGKRIGWDNEVMSFGVGFVVDKIAFDAAFVPTVFVNDYEMKWSMAFTYRL